MKVTRTRQIFVLVDDTGKHWRPFVHKPSKPEKPFAVKRAIVSWEEDEKCEGCNRKASRHDSEGVPLCGHCYNSMVRDYKKTAPVNG